MLQQAGNKEHLNFRGLIDTGATITCVTKELANGLELKSLGSRPMASASHIVQSDIYRVVIVIAIDLPSQIAEGNNLKSFETRPMSLPSIIEASTFSKSHENDVDVLIGMDVIRSSVLIYNGHDNRLTMSF